MDRRRFLAAGAAAALAGCSALDGSGEPSATGTPAPQALGTPSTTTDDDVTYYNLPRDGTPVLSVDVQVPPRERADATGEVLTVVTPHLDLTTAAVEVELRAPPDDADARPARVYATSSDGVPVTVERAADGRTTLSVDGLDGDADALPLRARVHPRDPVETLSVRARVLVRDGDGRYVGTVTDTLAMPTR